MAPFGDRGGSGDRDFDGKPGNSSDSRSYARIYDPGGQTELSNLPEPANYIEAQRLIQAAGSFEKQRESLERELLSDADSRVHLFPSVGKFIVPTQNTWAAHAAMVKDPDFALAFDPDRFVYFDKIVAHEFGKRALYDHNHKDYAKYEGLRTNLAVMRNDIIGMYLDDGSFDPGDEKYIPYFITIAAALGQSLAHDHWLKRPFTQHMSVDVANVEGVGAREMYKHLLDLQAPRGSVRGLLSHLPLLDIPNRAWGLKPLEETPYSDANLAAPQQEKTVSLTTDELTNYCAQNHVSPDQRTAVYSELALNNAISLNALDSLDKPAREQSIEEARTILRWLKNLQFSDMEVAEWMDQGTPAERVAKAESIARLTEIYSLQLADAHRRNPEITQSLSVEDANGAAGALAIGLAEYGLRGLPEDHPAAQHLLERARYVPENWQLFERTSVSILLDTLDEGLEYTSHRSLDPEVAAGRLLDIGNQMENTARRMRSLDTLKPPTREESVELAREILRRLRNMKFSDVTAEEAVTVGRPEEQSAFARNLVGLVDIYSSLLEQAAENNPEIILDPKIKEANDAVGTFSHAIKLMAAKEMPGSMAAAQQISADITQMPDEWKQLHEHTVDRLLANMEGGLSHAVEEVELQMQEARDQDEELAQQVVESSLVTHHHHRKRRRKKRLSSAVGGLTKAAKRRSAMDLNGDGVADRLQGLNIRGDDMIAIKKLGDSLRDISKEAERINLQLAEIGLGDVYAPAGERNFLGREKEPRPPSNRNRN